MLHNVVHQNCWCFLDIQILDICIERQLKYYKQQSFKNVVAFGLIDTRYLYRKIDKNVTQCSPSKLLVLFGQIDTRYLHRKIAKMLHNVVHQNCGCFLAANIQIIALCFAFRTIKELLIKRLTFLAYTSKLILFLIKKIHNSYQLKAVIYIINKIQKLH